MMPSSKKESRLQKQLSKQRDRSFGLEHQSAAFLRKQRSNKLGQETGEETRHSRRQIILGVFAESFLHLLHNPKLPELIQGVKKGLFHREFTQVFGDGQNLEVYAVRWSPSRSLAYYDYLSTTPEILNLLNASQPVNDLIPEDSRCRKVACLGGGAGAEVIAFAALLNDLVSPLNHDGSVCDVETRQAPIPSRASSHSPAHVSVFDTGSWGSVLQELQATLAKKLPCRSSDDVSPQPPECTPLAALSELKGEASSANRSEPSVLVQFTQQDLLSAELSSSGEFAEAMRESCVVTLCFTLNELYCTSLPKTTSLLLQISDLVKPGTLLLVIDSPGDYSVVRWADRTYPMHWLLDHTLLELAAPSKGGKKEESVKENRIWDKIEEDRSRWFRRAAALQYPIDLQDIRYQVHLYKRI